MNREDGVNERDEREKRDQGVREQNREREKGKIVTTGKKKGQEEVGRESEGLRVKKREGAGEW